MKILVLLLLTAGAVGCGLWRSHPPLDPPPPYGDPPEEPQPSARGSDDRPDANRCREEWLEPERKDPDCREP